MPTPSELAQQSDLGYRYIPLSAIDPSPTNPRKHFDKQKLDELAESIVRLGVLQPIVVRPRGERYEIVAGERRYRAASLVAFEQIPCTVRDLDDKATLEVQVVENLQRDDLHPLEEAEGYAALLRDHGYDADTLALKIGKSRSYVYARLKLMELCPAAKKALFNNVISHSVALLIARIPDAKLQAGALETIAGGGREPLSYRRAFEHIENNYMLRLSEAPWKRNDAELLPAAGACTTCLFRTGNQKELFGDVKSADVCTKPPCYQRKMDAHWKRVTDAAKEEGLRVLPAGEEKAVFAGYGGRFDNYGSYLDVDSKISYDSKKTYRSALGTKIPQITVAREPATGKIYHLLPRKDADGALVAAGLKKKERASESGNGYLRKQKAEAAKRKLERAVEAAVIAEMRPLLATLPLSTAALRIFTKSMALGNTYRMEEVFKRRGIEYPKYDKRNAAIVKFVDGLSDGEMVLVGAELQLNFTNMEQRSAEEKTLLRELAALVGVDAGGIDKRIRAEAVAKAAKNTKKKAPKAVAKPTAKRVAKKKARA